jgi:hypothetical protein
MLKNLIYILALFSFTLVSGSDSLKVKDKKFIIGINFSKLYLPYRPGNIQFNSLEWHGGKLKAMYLIPGVPKNNLAAGFDMSFTNIYFSEYVQDIENMSPSYYYAYIYEPNLIRTQNTNGNIGILFSLYGFRKRFYFSHDLGIRFSFFAKNKIVNKYTETFSSSGSHYSQDSVSASNPSGMYYYNSTTVSEIKQTYTFYNTIVPFYNIDLGLRFGNVIPHISFELTYYPYFLKAESDRFFNPYVLKGLMFRTNFGVAYRL